MLVVVLGDYVLFVYVYCLFLQQVVNNVCLDGLVEDFEDCDVFYYVVYDFELLMMVVIVVQFFGQQWLCECVVNGVLFVVVFDWFVLYVDGSCMYEEYVYLYVVFDKK